MELLRDLVFDYTLRNVALGSAILGIVGGALGSFAVLRRQALLGDALSHAALPGICVAFLIAGSRSPIVLLLGAAIAGWLGTLLMLVMIRETRLSEDTALGVVLSTFFGFGIVLLTAISRQNLPNQAGLDAYLFGQAAALVARNVATLAILGAVALAVVLLLYKEFKLLAFDPDFAASLGFNTRLLDILLTSLLVVAVVIGLQTVGVVLMAAMIIGPGVAARQWTDQLRFMLPLAALFGAAAGVSGALLSVTEASLPTGPMIILSLTAIVALSLAFGTSRGLIWEQVRLTRQRRATPDALGLPPGLEGDEA